VPVAGSFALTHRCNLGCVHCYLGAGGAREELATGQILRLLDEVVEAGCLTMLITGGEPLLRPDFGQVYRHAKTSGLLVTVFTNGTLVSDRIVELFTELPPRMVEISLYGATASTYERITGVPGSFERCLRGFQRLRQAGVALRLKTMLMTWNSHEFLAMEQLAAENDVPFRFDAGISPRLDGSREPLALRVAPEDAVGRELADPVRVSAWREYYEQRRNAPALDTLYDCGAGLIAFHIDPYGQLQPCLMTGNYGYDLMSGSFLQGWHQAMPAIRGKKAPAAMECRTCEKRSLCGYCPAFFVLEEGAEDTPSAYLCAVGRLRYNTIVNTSDAGRQDGVQNDR